MGVDRRYRKPPVVEALCEMYFEGSEWDDTLIGQFYERVKAQFPQKRQREIQEAQVRFSSAGEAAAGVRRLPPRMQFVTEAGDRMIQLGPDLLVVNQLRPYASFEEWEKTLHDALDTYRELAHPKGLARLGVRYIDRVIVRQPTVRMEDYFALYPEIPPAVGTSHGAFVLRVEFPERRPGHRLLVTFGSAPPEGPGTMAFLLDYYDVCEPGGATTAEAVRPIVRTAHENVIEAFEASITDQLRSLFEPEEKQS
ncbi:MAG: TIGR04255 family protein [Phycisphaerae bacterium]|nr:TIGR04255 family protein [Phycisphaerae bacterium]